MDSTFHLYYSGQPGNISATLAHAGETIATKVGLKDHKAAAKWALGAAELHRLENLGEEKVAHYVSVSGNKTFNL